MTPPAPKKPVDLEEIETALDRLPTAKRRQTKTELLKLMPSIQANLARGVPLAVMIKELKRLGIETSAKRIKDLMDEAVAQPTHDKVRGALVGAA